MVKRLEEVSKRDPRGYQLKVLGVVSLGFVYMLGILAVLLVIVAALAVTLIMKPNLLSFKLAIPFVGVTWVMLRSFKIKFDEPEGIVLTQRAVPVLFEEITMLNKKLKTIKIHNVLMV